MRLPFASNETGQRHGPLAEELEGEPEAVLLHLLVQGKRIRQDQQVPLQPLHTGEQVRAGHHGVAHRVERLRPHDVVLREPDRRVPRVRLAKAHSRVTVNPKLPT